MLVTTPSFVFVCVFYLVLFSHNQLQHDESATESWVPDIDPAEVVETMKRDAAVHPAIAAFIKTAPKGSVVNWQLKFRDPHEQWTSPGGRVVQLGDAG